jgi:N-acetylglucosamine-6-phosphate deacetylase
MELRATACLSYEGVHVGNYEYGGVGWTRYEHRTKAETLRTSSYFVTELPIDFHCHGVGRFDFSELRDLDLDEIDDILKCEGIRAVLTIYLEQSDLSCLEETIAAFDAARQSGKLRRIAGFAIEGPVLTSPGGTPLSTIWPPTCDEWRRLARLGRLGLKYIVLSPDIEIGPHASEFIGGSGFPPSIDWIVELLLEWGVMPAFGHFQKINPEASARCLDRLIDLGSKSRTRIITDHLLNDMPRKIRHAWRTPSEREHRARDLAGMAISEWTLENVDERLGPVPGAIIKAAAQKRRITPCLNFDGEHVDIAISTRLLELIGSENVIGMTDRIESRRLGGRELERSPDNHLLYQREGLVAAGSQEIPVQVSNALLAGVRPEDVWNIFCFVPAKVLGLLAEQDQPPRPAMFVQPGSQPVAVGL